MGNFNLYRLGKILSLNNFTVSNIMYTFLQELKLHPGTIAFQEQKQTRYLLLLVQWQALFLRSIQECFQKYRYAIYPWRLTYYVDVLHGMLMWYNNMPLRNFLEINVHFVCYKWDIYVYFKSPSSPYSSYHLAFSLNTNILPWRLTMCHFCYLPYWGPFVSQWSFWETD